MAVLPELKTDYGPDLPKIASQVAAIKQAETQNAIANMGLQDKLATRNILSSTMGTGEGGGYQNAANELFKKGLIKEGSEVAKVGALYNKSDSEGKLKQIQLREKALEVGAKLLPMMKGRPQYWPQFVEDISKIDPSLASIFDHDLSKLPVEQFDKAIDALQQAAMNPEIRAKLLTPHIQNVQIGDQEKPIAIMPGQGTAGVSVLPGMGGPKWNPDSKASNMQSVVQDAESPTGWSKVDNKGNKISGAAPPMSISRTNQPLSSSDEQLAQMIANSEMAPAQMAKRSGNYNAVLARAKEINPGLDIREADTNYNVGKTASFKNKDITVQAMPEILGKVTEAGKKLNYSNVQFIGKLEAWKNGQLNEPDFVKYMTLRNDALLSIAGVMRGVGATDQAHRVEVEAAAATMSPQALDAWMEGQMESLKPRLEQYNKIYNRKQGQTNQHPLTGKPAGIYRNKSGLTVKWDGSKEIQ